MRLLDLVEQHQAVGSSPDRVRELALLVVADVAWWAADELGDSVFLHVLTHVQANHGLLLAEVGGREGLAQLGLAHTRGPAEDEGGDGPAGALEPGPGPAHGLGDGSNSLLLTDDTLVERVIQGQEAHTLVRVDLLDGHARPGRDHLRHVVLRDNGPREGLLHILSAQGRNIDLHLRFPAVCRYHGGGHGRGRIGVVGPLLDQGVDLHRQLILLSLELLGKEEVLQLHRLVLLLLDVPEQGPDLLGGVRDLLQLLQLNACAGLVHDVDGLVRQEAVLDVLRGELHASDQCLVGVRQLVVDLVAARQAPQDLHRLIDCGLRHLHWLEAALQGLVLLDVLAVLLDCGRPDDLHLASRERRLQHVRGVHGAAAAGAAGADEGVDLVDHQDDVTLGLGHLLDDVLESFLELTSVLGACEQAREVELNDLLAPQELWNVSVGDALRKTLGDRGLANAGLADEHRVVLLAARQNLNGPLQLLRAANHGVQLAVKRSLREVFAELLQHRRFAPFACSRLDATGCHSLLRLRDLCQLSQDLFRHLADVHAEPLQDLR
mmetsp:Transcript_67005/g.216608  ORF Transcript_67005/g.216608 Transcript_67005/m.216608 type:complete len:549 (+) Transcript_67005:866-2512(+)